MPISPGNPMQHKNDVFGSIAMTEETLTIAARTVSGTSTTMTNSLTWLEEK